MAKLPFSNKFWKTIAMNQKFWSSKKIYKKVQKVLSVKVMS